MEQAARQAMGDDLLTSVTETFYAGPARERENDHAQLFFVEGSRKGGIVELSGGKTRVGRGSENEIQLATQGISKQHLIIEALDDGRYYLIDCRSKNGTRVNGREVSPNLPFNLTHGDIISLIGHEFIFLNTQRSARRDYSEAIEIDEAQVAREAEEFLKTEPDILALRRRRRGG